MGRGNVCTLGRAEGLYFVDNDFLDVYKKMDSEEMESEDKYITPRDEGFDFDACVYCEPESAFKQIDFEWELSDRLIEKFPSFNRVDKWITNSRRALLENKLFYIVVEDNMWSVAVELIQKQDPYGGDDLVGLQMGLYARYLDAIKDILLDMHGEVGIYTGAWTSATIKKGC